MQKTHPLQVLKFCPKCGSAAFKKKDEKSLKCENCGFHLFINSSAAVAALVSNPPGKLMLVKRGIEPHYGKYDLPGGFVDPGETAEDAVVRELHEELGLRVKKLEYLDSATNEYIYSGYSVFTLDLAFKIIPETLENLTPMDDILEYRFFAKDEIDFDEVPAPSIQYFINQYFKK
ncbi:MAG: NUDIX domain-containing protein [Prolixibacteraceae bacterium]